MSDPSGPAAQFFADLLFGHLERRICTKEAPMKMEQKDDYRWGHPDAAEVKPFFNLMLYDCPHCGLTFASYPRASNDSRPPE